MTWTAPTFIGGSAIIDYRIYYKQPAGEVWSTLVDDVTTTSYVTTALVSGTSYEFKIASRNAYGVSETESTVITVLQAQVPNAPINLANDASLTKSDQIGLTWSAGAFDGASAVVDYRVQSDQGTGTWIDLATGVTVTNFKAIGLNADTVYKFRV